MNDRAKKTREINGKLDEIAPYPAASAGATAPALARYLAKQALVTSELAAIPGRDPGVHEMRAVVAEFAAAHALAALAAADPNAANQAAMEIYEAWEDGEGVHWWPWQHLGDDAEPVALLARELAEEGPRPRVICLCGSARFAEEYREWLIKFVMAGHTVLGTPALDLDPRSIAAVEAVQAAHLRLIRMSDEVFVINPQGYIGDDTRREIDYAFEAGKTIKFLESLTLEDAYAEGWVPGAPKAVRA